MTPDELKSMAKGHFVLTNKGTYPMRSRLELFYECSNIREPYYGAVNMLEEDGFPSTLNHHLPDSPEGMVMGYSNLRERTELREKATVECYITHKLELAPVIIFHGTKDRTKRYYCFSVFENE